MLPIFTNVIWYYRIAFLPFVLWIVEEDDLTKCVGSHNRLVHFVWGLVVLFTIDGCPLSGTLPMLLHVVQGILLPSPPF